MNYLLRKMQAQARKWTRDSLRYAAKPAIARLPGWLAAQRAALNSMPGLAAHEDLQAGTARRDPVAAPAGNAEQWLAGTFRHRGRLLAYKLYLPPPRDRPATVPLVVMLHGCTQDAEDFAAGTQMNARARAAGVAVLYPEQSARDNPKQCWNWFTPQNQQRGRGEPAVLAALTRSIAASHAVDDSRIYVAGLSAGGAMAAILGSSYPEVFAAVGVHSGLPPGCANDVMSAFTAMRSGCAPGQAAPAAQPLPPTIVFHGDADHTVHTSNGMAIVDAAITARGAQATTARATAGQSAQGQRYSQTSYQDSGGRTAVEYWQLHGAGHAWSGGKQGASYTDPAGVDASTEMLRFFLAQPRKS